MSRFTDFAAQHLPTLVWAALCAVLLTLPGDNLTPPEPGLKLLEDPAHGVLAFVLAWLTARSFARLRTGPGGLRLAVVATLVYLLLLEGLQTLIPGRGWEWSDLAFTLLGVALAWWIRRRPLPERTG